MCLCSMRRSGVVEAKRQQISCNRSYGCGPQLGMEPASSGRAVRAERLLSPLSSSLRSLTLYTVANKCSLEKNKPPWNDSVFFKKHTIIFFHQLIFGNKNVLCCETKQTLVCRELPYSSTNEKMQSDPCTRKNL